MRYDLRKVQPTSDGQPVYLHPEGYYLVRDVRDWNWVRHSAGWTPKVSWLVVDRKRHGGSWPEALRNPVESFRTLREAATWCNGCRRSPRGAE